jgi:hypothetical protein
VSRVHCVCDVDAVVVIVPLACASRVVDGVGVQMTLSPAAALDLADRLETCAAAASLGSADVIDDEAGAVAPPLRLKPHST